MNYEPHSRGHLLRGARALADYIFGNEELHRSVYGLAGELPLFVMGGRLCGYTASLDRAIAEKEHAAMSGHGGPQNTAEANRSDMSGSMDRSGSPRMARRFS